MCHNLTALPIHMLFLQPDHFNSSLLLYIEISGKEKLSLHIYLLQKESSSHLDNILTCMPYWHMLNYSTTCIA